MRKVFVSVLVLMVLGGVAQAQTVDDLETGPAPTAPAAPPAQVPAAPSPAYTPPPVAAKSFQREGFTIGVGLGLGAVSVEDDSGAGLGFSLRMGGMVNERLAILGEIESVTHFADGIAFTSTFFGPSVMGFVSDQVWLSSGLGLTWLGASDGYVRAESNSGVALLLAGGVEVHQSGSFAMSIEFRVHAGRIDGVSTGAGQLALGFQWY